MKSLIEIINWEKCAGLVPAIVQDADTGTVLMLGYMNREALEKTLSENVVWFYSRTKQRLWKKGEESGNELKLNTIAHDCDSDTLLVSVSPVGPTCHTGSVNCFGVEGSALSRLFETVKARKESTDDTSYTKSLFIAGKDRIGMKVMEEALEVVHAADKDTDERVREEAADLLYHLIVLLANRSVSFKDVAEVLSKRAAR